MTSFIHIEGNLTRDPEVVIFESGNTITKLRVAVNDRRRKADGTWEDQEPTFYTVVVFNGMATNVAASLLKGATVSVTGRHRIRTYDKSDGSGKGWENEVLANEVSASLRWATAEVTKNPKTGGGHDAPAEEGDYFDTAAPASA